MPITMGIIMAATPVLERNPERSAVTRLTAKTCFRSLLANLMANVAMSWASPVAKMAWPITRKAPIKITFELEKPATASDADRHPHRQRASVVHMAVRARGIFSVTIRMMEMIMMKNVAIMVFIWFLPSSYETRSWLPAQVGQPSV